MKVVTTDDLISWIVKNIHPNMFTEEEFDCDCHWCTTYANIMHIEARILKIGKK
jgi:hypothetical protein